MARSLTSTATMWEPEQARASAQAIGPYPQPRSRNVPLDGGGVTDRIRTAVPGSSRVPENTPPAVVIVMESSQTLTVIVRVRVGPSGVVK